MDGQLELVSQLFKPVATGMITSYYGCPPDSVPDLAEWASTIFQYLFTDLKNDPAVDVAARAASAHVRDWLDRHIAKQKGKWLHHASEAMLQAVRDDWEVWKKKGYA